LVHGGMMSFSVHLLHAWLQVSNQGAHVVLQLQVSTPGHCWAADGPCHWEEGRSLCREVNMSEADVLSL